MKPHPLTLTGMLALCLTVPAAFAAETPVAMPAAKPGVAWGAADVQPTPEHPVYFRWCQGYFPGAQPPLEFWEGTPVEVDGQVKSKSPGKVETCKLLSFADQKSKNILWKVPVPGWGLSHPIVVGKRVFGVGHPDFVACWDLETGKQLWQRRIMPLMLEGRAVDKLPAMPALDEAQAAKAQKVIDLAHAIWLVTGAPPGGSTSGTQEGNFYNHGTAYGNIDKMDMTEGTVAKRTAFVGKVLRMAQKHRPDVEAFGDVELLKALDEDIAILQSWAKAQQDPAALSAVIKDSNARTTRLVSACAKKFNLPFGGYWFGYVGYADSSLASDGQRLYGVFDQGQVFCLDLDGKLLWGFREQGPGRDNRGTFHRSPQIAGDLVLFQSLQATQVAKMGKVTGRARAFDARSGELRWDEPFPTSYYAPPKVIPLARPDGTVEPVLFGSVPHSTGQGFRILRVKDGKPVGEAPPGTGFGRGLLLGNVGDVVMWSSTDDGGGGDNAAYRLQWTGPDSVTTQPLFLKQDKKDKPWSNQEEHPTIANRIWRYGNALYDATTGEKVAQITTGLHPNLRLSFTVVAGNYLIGMVDAGGGSNSDYGRQRPDRMAAARFVVVDISDPAKPKMVSNRNLLGYAEPPADLYIRDYFTEFDPYLFARGYGGAPGYFSHMGGPVPIGNKLLIQTSAFLYCIGEK